MSERDWRGPHVLVSGPPGSGKSTLAKSIADELRWPMVARDDLLELLFDALAISRTDESERARVQAAATRLQLHLLRTMPSMVDDGGWWANRHEPDLLATGRTFIQVFCSCPLEDARARVRARRRWDSDILDENYERFSALSEPLKLPGPLLEVNTTEPVDVASITASIRSVATSRR